MQGCPIRISSAHSLASSSPKLFVGNHVLLRLCVPRYPPLALCSLTTINSFVSVFSTYTLSTICFLFRFFFMQFSWFWLDITPAVWLYRHFAGLFLFCRFRSNSNATYWAFDFPFLPMWAILDSNQGPHPYQGCALTT